MHCERLITNHGLTLSWARNGLTVHWQSRCCITIISYLDDHWASSGPFQPNVRVPCPDPRPHSVLWHPGHLHLLESQEFTTIPSYSQYSSTETFSLFASTESRPSA